VIGGISNLNGVLIRTDHSVMCEVSWTWESPDRSN